MIREPAGPDSARDTLEVLRAHQRHLMQRLTVRSPLLRFAPSAYREDVTKLFDGILENPPATVPAGTGRIAPVTSARQLLERLLAGKPDKVEIRNAETKAVAKCRRIFEQGDDWQRATGQPSIFLAYPLVFVPLEDKKYLLAPLFFWDVKLGFPPGATIRIERLQDDEDGEALEPRFNRVLNAWLKHRKNIALQPQENVVWEGLSGAVKAACNDWPECNSQFTPDRVQSVPEAKQLKAWADENAEPRIVAAGMLGYCSFKGQAQLDDLDQIIRRVEQGEAELGVLRRFVAPRPTENDPVGKTAFRELRSVTPLDHSQEASIAQARASSLMVLQGPPGTGKSQTIVNLIADAIHRGQRVLVVCEKQAALDVILKRLRACGLDHLALHVKDAIKDRVPVIKGIRNINSDLGVTLENDTSGELEAPSSLIRSMHDALDLHPSYGDMRARLHRLRHIGANHRNAVEALEHVLDAHRLSADGERERMIEHVCDAEADIRACSYFQNPWRHAKRTGQILPHEVTRLRDDIAAIVDHLDTVQEHAPAAYREQVAWLAEHSYAARSHAAFLAPADRAAYSDYVQGARRVRPLVKQWLPAGWLEKLLPHRAGPAASKSRLKELMDFAPQLPEAVRVRERIAESKVLGCLEGHCRDNLEQWSDIVDAAMLETLRKQREQALAASSTEVVRAIGHIRRLVETKRAYDRRAVAYKFRNRTGPKNSLEDADLLKLRAGRLGPRTDLRKLFTKGFDALHRLYPVLLTNPDTACNMLPLERGRYDLLVIDEASQVFVSDAIPLLYRAQRVVVSGDQHQMPPSDYFVGAMTDNAVPGGDDDEDEDEDGELKNVCPNRMIPADGNHCLLDAAVAAAGDGSPASKRLLVHYRSDHAELIAFSNHAFYKGELDCPRGNREPLPCCPTPIVLRQVDGRFDSVSRKNGVEAREVVDTLKEVLDSCPNCSVGVITFNLTQRDHINDLIKEEMDSNAAFGRLYTSALEYRTKDDGEDEGLFVRSVEHVQGDERDLIIFSTTYDGMRSRQFGPISVKEKGRRRLNVAVTRAKKGIIIFTSLDIDRLAPDGGRTPNDTNEPERVYLWRYLRYARAISSRNEAEARSVLAELGQEYEAKRPTRDSAESPFEEDVAEFLVSSGFCVDHQVGECGFRIDLAVKTAPDSSNYLAGVECDGRCYHSDWPARLRDVWRQDILVKKGWRIVRVWSTDWYGDPERAKRRLLDEIQRPA